MDGTVKAFTRLGLASLDLPRLGCDLPDRASVDVAAESSVVVGGASSSSSASCVVRGASSTSGSDSVDAPSEAGSQDSLAVEADPEVPSSMSSMDDDDDEDDEYYLDDGDCLNRHTDDRLDKKLLSGRHATVFSVPPSVSVLLEM